MSINHLHIALVGGNPTPVYQGIVYTQPDKVILICSASTFSVAQNIKTELHYIEDVVEFREFSDDDLQKMQEQATKLLQEEIVQSAGTVSLNLSSGLKVWSLVFNDTFKSQLSNLEIFCLSQNGTVFNLTFGDSHAKVKFDMDAQFRLLGNEIASYTPFSDYTAEDLQLMGRIKNLASNNRYRETFKELTKEFVQKANNRVEPNSAIEVNKGDASLLWNNETHSFSIYINGHEFDCDEPHAWHILLNTGWFEVYVAKLLAQFFSPDNIRLNCLFKTKTDSAKNEVDIIVNTGEKLIFVECKTQVYNTTDVDKFESVVRTYGGLGSKALFVTYHPMKGEALEKCNEKRITAYCYPQSNNLNAGDKNRQMKQMLDKLIKEWNTK